MGHPRLSGGASDGGRSSSSDDIIERLYGLMVPLTARAGSAGADLGRGRATLLGPD